MNPFAQENADAAKKPSIRLPAAAMVRKDLAQAGVFVVRIIGHPGSGKTELIESTLKHLAGPKRVAVIVINPASGRDADRLRKLCGHVAQIDAAVPDAVLVRHALSELKLEQFDMLLIETAGGMAPLHDLGQDATVAVFAVSGGDDKAAEYHNLLNSASAILLTKSDLGPFVKFDGQIFRDDVRAINPSAEVYELSAMTGSGMPNWLQWLDRTRADKPRNRPRGESSERSSDRFIG